MAATLCGRILLTKSGWQPLAQSVRHAKAVTRHRKPMHFLKQKLMAVTEYIPPKPAAAPGAYPFTKTKKTKEESGLVRLLKKELETTFSECKMLAVLQNNAIKADDMLLLRHRLRRHNITIKFFPNEVMRSFLLSSKYSNMQPLFIGQTVMFVSKEPKVKEMLRVLKNSPQMVLLGGCVENTLLSREGILNYSRLPSITTVQGELVGGLTLMASQTRSMLHRHPAHLSALLQQYIKQKQPGGTLESALPETTPKTEEAAV